MLLTQSSPTQTHRTKEEFVYDTLRTAIVKCQLGPGQRLVIDNIKRELGVSAIPIRSALQRLNAEGFVEIIPHTGAVVSEISLDTINEIFLLLEAMEIAAANVVILNLTPENLTYFKQLIDQMDAALHKKDADQWYDLNNLFHLSFAKQTNMKMLVRFTQRALDSRDRLRRFFQDSFVAPRMAEAQKEHHQMIELLEKRDLAALKTLMSQHNNKAKKAYQKLIESQNRQQNQD